MDYEVVIGLEIHVQLATKTKIFCGCKSAFGDPSNTNGCPVCLGLPGALPVLNNRVVEMAVKAGHALNCEISSKSIFARKNYFYPDLPKGYQISQYDLPLCGRGELEIALDGNRRTIGITRIHLEEDAGKLIHDLDVDSLFDVNRCGTPLMEIVTEPDIRSPREAYEFLSSLKRILQYLEVSDCNMEEASLRCDANISLRPKGQKELGVKTELKNMNSFRGVEKALEYEIKRQTIALDAGEEIVQQTYLWDAQKGITLPMRSKEEAHDYRYFPEPDLVPLIVDDALVNEIRDTMPELPAARLQRYIDDLGLAPDTAAVLVESRAVGDYFEQTIAGGGDARTSANWVMGDVLRVCKDKRIEPNQLSVSPPRLARILSLVSDGTISGRAARKVFDHVENENKEPDVIVDKLGLKQISDTGALEQEVQRVVDENPEEAGRLKNGEAKLQGFFIGQIMRATKGKGNPKEINRILRELLGL